MRPRDLDPIMVRRLKSDLRHFGERFPKRNVDPIRISGLPEEAPELLLSHKLAAYGEVVRARAARLSPREAGQARLSLVGLQQRLLSSIAAFARTLEVHRRGLQRVGPATSEAGAEAFVHGGAETEEEPTEEAAGEKFIEEEEDRAAEAAAAFAAGVSDLALVDEMLEIARAHRHQPDARMQRLVDWIRSNMTSDGRWNERRLVLFTEYEDTRRWVQKRLAEALDDLEVEDRIAAFTGSTPAERREELKRRFNSDPAEDPLRILVCTDAAREGINLQMRCYDLIHIDLPWNPARLEQRNGRIDRKLQPSPEVWCRYFVYEQREEDLVHEALVRKTELIRDELGSAGHVLARQLTDRLEHEGIFRGRARRQAGERGDARRGPAVIRRGCRQACGVIRVPRPARQPICRTANRQA